MDLPLYLQISERVARDIEAGRILDGSRLPTEVEMAAGLDVSVGTLRKALAELSVRGLVIKRHGSGNYVRRTSAPTGIYAFFHLELVAGGGLPGARTLATDLCAEPPREVDWNAAWRMRRLRLLNAVPAALEEIWIDARHTAAMTPGDLPVSLYRHYATAFGLNIARVEDSVGAGEVPDWSPPEFPLAAGAPCGRVTRRADSREKRTEEVSMTWFDPATTGYVARWREDAA